LVLPLGFVGKDVEEGALIRFVNMTIHGCGGLRFRSHLRGDALLASSALTTVLTDSRPAALLALIAYTTVLADSRPAALLALIAYTTVLAD
jgi:hypothetical protein